MSGDEQAVRTFTADGSRVAGSLMRRVTVGVACGFALLACGGKTVDKDDAKAVAAPDAKDTAKGDAKDGKEPAAAESHAAVAASVAVVKSEPFSETIDATGVVSARTGHLATLSAPGATRIASVHVTIGSRVHAGDKLVSFETTAFDAAAASADAALHAAEQTAARAKRLVDAGVSPRKDAELAAAELAAAQSASVNARRTLQLATLRSPIDGVVTRLTATLGASADAGQTLVEVADTRSLDVHLVLSPSLAARVHNGQPVAFRDGAGSETERIADGRIADVSAVVDSNSRGVVVRVAVTTQKRPLRLGESIYGQILADTHKNAVVISDEALVPTGEGFQVFVVDSAGKAHARPVVIGARNSHRVWVREGLTAGETVVTAGAFGMDEGATVVTKKSPAP
ncbi:MAG: efflux RND transporter periplasmic adaptor subunit [Gemmatimonadota bacterium]|nr:efflux RND transporter periplasmic adaptor subunit [Gemmatimonadota bacterium]